MQFKVAQDLKEVCWNTDGYWELDPVLRESTDMMLMKLSRILTGQPLFEDHWADILGYGALARKRVQELQKAIDTSWVDAAAKDLALHGTTIIRVAPEDFYIENEPEND